MSAQDHPPAPFPGAQLVLVRERRTGRLLKVWPVDAREMVAQADGAYCYAPEATRAQIAAAVVVAPGLDVQAEAERLQRTLSEPDA